MNPPNIPTPPSGTSAGVQPGQPAPKSGGLFTTRNIIIALIGFLLLCVCGCGALFLAGGGLFASVLGQTVAPAAVGAQFLGNVVAGDYEAAYSLCGTSLKRELGSAANLGKRISDGAAQLVSFTPNKTDLKNDRLELSGTAVFSGNRNGTFELVIGKEGNDWKVIGFNLKPN